MKDQIVVDTFEHIDFLNDSIDEFIAIRKQANQRILNKFNQAISLIEKIYK